jgi:hypothetical protein
VGFCQKIDNDWKEHKRDACARLKCHVLPGENVPISRKSLSSTTKVYSQNMKMRRIHLVNLALELLVVFIGVSLGFYSDSLRQGFIDREKEKNILSNLLTDINDAKTNLNDKIETLNEQVKYGDLILKYRHSQDSVLKGMYNGNFGWVKIFSKGLLLSYEIAKNTGGIETIRNQKIVRKLYVIEQWSDYIVDVETFQNTFVDDYLKPYVISTVPFPVNELADDPLFRNYKKSDYCHDPKLFELTIIMREYFRGHQYDYKRLLKELDDLEKEIKSEVL